MAMEAGEWVGVVAGVLGTGVGIAGLVAAIKANTKARDANRLATDANTKADSANHLATEANRLAEEANRMTRGEVEREVERHDVQWGGDWAGPGRYVVTNESTYTAHKVHVRVTVDDEAKDAYAEQVGPGGSVELNFPRAAENLVADRREFRAERERAQRANGPFGPGPANALVGRTHWIEERATWETDRGAQRVWEPKGNGLCTLGELE